MYIYIYISKLSKFYIGYANSTRVTQMNLIKIFNWVDFFDPGHIRDSRMASWLLQAP